MKANMIPVYVL